MLPDLDVVGLSNLAVELVLLALATVAPPCCVTIR